MTGFQPFIYVKNLYVQLIDNQPLVFLVIFTVFLGIFGVFNNFSYI
jgi:hypothetical protein